MGGSYAGSEHHGDSLRQGDEEASWKQQFQEVLAENSKLKLDKKILEKKYEQLQNKYETLKTKSGGSKGEASMLIDTISKLEAINNDSKTELINMKVKYETAMNQLQH